MNIYFFLKKVFKFLTHWYKKLRSVEYPIVQSPEKKFEIVATIKYASWEEATYWECYHHNKEQCLEVYTPAEYIYRTYKGIVNTGSDVVITSKGVYWCKYNQDEFVTWAKPVDGNVVSFDRKNIKVLRAKKTENISGRVLSLIGLWSHHWVHCLYEFIPKIFAAGEAGILNKPITILVVRGEDPNMLEVINNYLKLYPLAHVKFADNGVDYICEELFFIPNLGPCFCDYRYRLDYPFVITRNVLDKIYKYIVNPLILDAARLSPRYDKIFLGRTSGQCANKRSLINSEEVHDYFVNLGFVDVEGAALTLEEKAHIFYHAKEIVVIHGSSLLNLMFCNQAKCMILGNFRFSNDEIAYPFIKKQLKNCIYVTGQDESDEYHSNFYIPLKKIKTVYNKYIRTY